MKNCYQLYADPTGALFIISAGDPEEADCLAPVGTNRENALYILEAVNSYAAAHRPTPRRKP